MQPNPSSLVNMTTNSDRNLSFSQQQALFQQDQYPEELTVARMWPNASVTPIPNNSPVVVMTPALRKQLDDAVAKAKIKTEAIKFDAGKVDWTLVPFEALEGMAQVLEFGAKKYDSWNWTTGGGFKWTRILASCFRHLFAFMRGEDVDPESGLSHISHCQCNLLFIAYYIRHKDKYGNDDRHVKN